MKLDPNSPECQTPLMKQFLRLKTEVNDSLLFFRMGDFYELFGEDAIIAAPILGITLTARNKTIPNPIPMAGLPYHSATNYIQKLLNAGKKVSIAEQIVPEGMTIDQIKGIVDRQIVRTFTPAVQFELSQDGGSNYLATLLPENAKELTLVLLNPATGDVVISKPILATELGNEIALSSIKHFLNVSTKLPAQTLALLESRQCLIEDYPANSVATTEVTPFLKRQYTKEALHPLLDRQTAQTGLALLLHYILKSQGIKSLAHLKDPRSLHESNRLVLGPHTFAHLDGEELLTLINQTSTSMGARRLRMELESPLKELNEIKNRQAAVSELAKNSLESLKIFETLKEVYDLDRILGRVSTRLANPRDTYALAKSVLAAFQFQETLSRFQSANLHNLSERMSHAFVAVNALAQKIVKTQKSEAPTHTRDGGIFELGTDPALDHLIKLTTEGERFLIELEQREREASGIGSLKVKYNRVFGYFIEISSANLKNVPAHYQRKQTMVGGERFFTEELKKFEEEILSAAQKQRAMESKLFEQLIEELILLATPLKELADILAELDMLVCLSKLAHSGSWVFPEIDLSLDFKLKASRHPVVDQALKGAFVPNDVELSAKSVSTLLITGPNMGGKSTLMRQMAQIIMLGQIGAPVPAQAAQWGVFHSIYTRIGAHDAIAKGQSTFMVEMVELAHILTNANERSFVVLDEIGRGTSTFDGMSVAHAGLEYLHKRSNARIVFATHYHELTVLESRLPGLKNAYMKVLDENGKLTFLYEMSLGRSSKSFGIQVAELAGVPKPVIKKAWEILKILESQSLETNSQANQLSLFAQIANDEQVSQTIIDTHSSGMVSDIDLALLKRAVELQEYLRDLDLDSMRPIEALQYVTKLKHDLLS
jgi:DNA mismatch repair protein MutS